MRFLFLGLAVIAAMMFGEATAQAGFVNGIAAFMGGPSNPTSGTVLDARTVIGLRKIGGTMDFAAPGIPNDVSTTWSNFAIANPMPSGGGFVLNNATFGIFTSAALLSDDFDTNIVNGNGSRTIVYNGAFQAGSLFSAGVQDLTDANLSIELRQITSGPTTFFMTSIRLTAFGDAPSVVPEPTSIAIFGLGALGIVARRRFPRK